MPERLSILPQDADRAREFYRHLRRLLQTHRAACVVLVTHVLPDRPLLLEALADQARIAGIIAKPRSIFEPARAHLMAASYPLLDLTRGDLEDPELAIKVLTDVSAGEPLALLDIGGYFAPVIEALHEALGDQLLGVVEDTENGHQKYMRRAPLPVPVLSVARSDLKVPEDHLTGEAIAFSFEALLRECGQVMYGRRAAVFGYGKIGRSIARAMLTRDVRTSVVDNNYLRAIEAAANRFRVLEKRHALATADFIFCATGNLSLKSADFGSLRNGAFIASVTSSDDELDLSELPHSYHERAVSEVVTCYTKEGHYFYLLNQGNAVNFLHGAVLGPFIHLVQAEVLAGLAVLQASERKPPGLTAITNSLRQKIARLWFDTFYDNQIIIPGTL